ncbi:GFA family protein (plasmid) [Streptomyces sp. BB1-1-1]|uniref:GFA family protein n=1 Tax=Streptomyces sp. BB1-1-1 TaxID=3074430 RepID=UPI002877BBAC|nr:GFA family protein [Streptomyces sp. BB1-1-1]WND40731.1 GFA family protein [Streptomyces sp. BB1-1-1]
MNATPDIVAAAQERSGGCLCGKIRFTVKGEAVYPHTCSCPHCQKLGGGPMMWWAGFAPENITWTGESEQIWFETFKGEAKRSCCPNCFSRLAAIDNGVPEIGIVVTALDDTSGDDLVPINQSFRDNAVHWLPQVPDTQKKSPVG